MNDEQFMHCFKQLRNEQNTLLDSIGDAVNEATQVFEYVNPQPGSYSSMPQYEQDEMAGRGLKILEALASHYDLVSVEQLLTILEQNRGKR